MCDWFLPKTMAEQLKWSVAFDAANMEKEEPNKYVGRIDRVVGVLTSLRVLKSAAEVNRNIIMMFTSECETAERTILYREGVTCAEIESIVRQRHWRLPASKGKNVGRALF